MIVTAVMVFLTIVVSLFGAELFGYLYHRLAHVPGSALYRSHMVHHVDVYPPNDFVSEGEYRKHGLASFSLWFVPVFLLFSGIQFLLLPFWLFLIGFATTCFCAAMNVWVHDSVHVSGKGIETMRRRHYVHHRNMRKNYAIWWFFWDRVFGTLKEPAEKSRVSEQA